MATTRTIGLTALLAVLVAACTSTPEAAGPETTPPRATATQAPPEPDPNLEAEPDIYVVDPRSGAVTP